MLKNPGAGAWIIAASALPVHTIIAARTQLTPDEAYYWAAGRYGTIPDHPPLVVWTIGACDGLKALPLELRVRLPVLLSSALLTLAMAALAGEEDGEPPGPAPTIAALLATWLPLPMAGGFITTPDTFAMLAVVAALAWGRAPAPSWRRSAVTSLLVACGGLAKIVVVPVALLSAWVTARAGAPERCRPWLAAAWLLPSALTLPWLVPSLQFQVPHAFAPHAWTAGAAASSAIAFVASAGLLWSPPIVGLGLRGVVRLPRIHAATFWLITGLTLMSALFRALPPEPNWWTPAAIPLLVASALELAARPHRQRVLTLALAIAPTLVAITHVLHPWLPLPRRLDPTARLHGWRTDPPLNAPGTGPYAGAAEACAYRNDCDEIRLIIQHVSQ